MMWTENFAKLCTQFLTHTNKQTAEKTLIALFCIAPRFYTRKYANSTYTISCWFCLDSRWHLKVDSHNSYKWDVHFSQKKIFKIHSSPIQMVCCIKQNKTVLVTRFLLLRPCAITVLADILSITSECFYWNACMDRAGSWHTGYPPTQNKYISKNKVLLSKLWS